MREILFPFFYAFRANKSKSEFAFIRISCRFSYSLSRSSGVVTGLNGAIQRLIVNGNAIENLMDHAKDSREISDYEGPPCDQHKCLNGGQCKPFFRSYVCKCKHEFMGHFCEKGTKAVSWQLSFSCKRNKSSTFLKE